MCIAEKNTSHRSNNFNLALLILKDTVDSRDFGDQHMFHVYVLNVFYLYMLLFIYVFIYICYHLYMFLFIYVIIYTFIKSFKRR